MSLHRLSVLDQGAEHKKEQDMSRAGEVSVEPTDSRTAPTVGATREELIACLQRVLAVVSEWRERAKELRDDDEDPFACDGADVMEDCADMIVEAIVPTEQR